MFSKTKGHSFAAVQALVQAGASVNHVSSGSANGYNPLDQALACLRTIRLQFDEVIALRQALENPSLFPVGTRGRTNVHQNGISPSDVERIVAISQLSLPVRTMIRGDLLDKLGDVRAGVTLFLVDIGSSRHQIINFLLEHGAQ